MILDISLGDLLLGLGVAAFIGAAAGFVYVGLVGRKD
jgi:hypothetical protein